MRSATTTSDSRARAAAAGTGHAFAIPVPMRAVDAASVCVTPDAGSLNLGPPAASAFTGAPPPVNPVAAAMSPPAAPGPSLATAAMRHPPQTAAAASPAVAAALTDVHDSLQHGLFNDALTQATRARAKYPNDLGVAAAYCKAAITAGCYTASLAAADQVLAAPMADEAQKSLAQQTRARALLNLGRYDEARRLCDTELMDGPTATALRAVADLQDDPQSYGDLLGTLQHQPATQVCEMAVAAAYVAAKQRISFTEDESAAQRIYQADAAAALNYAGVQGHARKPVWKAAVATANILFGTDAEREAAHRLLRNDASLHINPLASLVRLNPALQLSANQKDMTNALKSVNRLLRAESAWVPAHAVRVALLMRIGTAAQRQDALAALQKRLGNTPDNLDVVSLIACLHDRNENWQQMLDTLNTGVAAQIRAANEEEEGEDSLTPRAAKPAPAVGREFDAVNLASDLDEQLLRAHTKLQHWQAAETLVDRLCLTLAEALHAKEQGVSPTMCVVIGEAASQLGSRYETAGNKLHARQLYSRAKQALMASLDAAPGGVELPLRAAQACIDYGRLAEHTDAQDAYQTGLGELENLTESTLSKSQIHTKKLAEARFLLSMRQLDECRATLQILNGTEAQADADRIALIANVATEVYETFANVDAMRDRLDVCGPDRSNFSSIIKQCNDHLQRRPGAVEYLAARGAAYLKQGRIKKACDDLRLARRGLPTAGRLSNWVINHEELATALWKRKNIVGRSGTRTYDFVHDHPFATLGVGLVVVGAVAGADLLFFGGRATTGTANVFNAGAQGFATGVTGATGDT